MSLCLPFRHLYRGIFLQALSLIVDNSVNSIVALSSKIHITARNLQFCNYWIKSLSCRFLRVCVDAGLAK